MSDEPTQRSADEEDADLSEEDAGLVPYAPDFTPTLLGKKIGEDAVLPWLLDRIAERKPKSELSGDIGATCLSHIKTAKSRRDMSSHVIQALQNYLLMVVDDRGRVQLTDVGNRLRQATAQERDALFARHILTRCNGYRLVEEIHHLRISGREAKLELLAERLDRNSTSKSISTMRAWLHRGGVFGKGYSVKEQRLEELLGSEYRGIVRLDSNQLEFLLAARNLATIDGTSRLSAPDVKKLAELRSGQIQIPAKSLSGFVRALQQAGFVDNVKTVSAKGGSRTTFKLVEGSLGLGEDEMVSLSRQSRAHATLADIPQLSTVLESLSDGGPDELGRQGEMLAVHACLLLGCRLVGWRSRTPVEVDLTATRTTGLTYQRWQIQVKNTADDMSADRVDREVGVAAGTGATHVLFVVPRATLTGPARAEVAAKNRLTHLHILFLDREAFEGVNGLGSALITSLRRQTDVIARLKDREAVRRETLS